MMLNLRLDANPINTAVPLTGLLGGAGEREGTVRLGVNCKME